MFREFGLINVHLFDVLTAISSGKVRKSQGFFCPKSSNPVCKWIDLYSVNVW